MQFPALQDNDVYLELVTPDGPDSKLTGAVKRGAALNHLCYITSDLGSAIAHMEEQGMRLISDLHPGVAFAGRQICWLLGDDMVPIELLEQFTDADPGQPGL